jgi:hypothetical protein
MRSARRQYGAEKSSEKDYVLMTDSLTDLLHGAVVALQQVLGCGTRNFCK